MTNCLACLEGYGRHAIDCPERDRPMCAVCGDRGCEFCPAVRRQELVDRLEQERITTW